VSLHSVLLVLEVDDEALTEHVANTKGEQPPYTADLAQWNADDIARAAELEIVDLGESSFTYQGPVTRE